MILQRIRFVVGDARFEPRTSVPKVWCTTIELPHVPNKPPHLHLLNTINWIIVILVSASHAGQLAQLLVERLLSIWPARGVSSTSSTFAEEVARLDRKAAHQNLQAVWQQHIIVLFMHGARRASSSQAGFTTWREGCCWSIGRSQWSWLQCYITSTWCADTEHNRVIITPRGTKPCRIFLNIGTFWRPSLAFGIARVHIYTRWCETKRWNCIKKLKFKVHKQKINNK